MSDSYSNWVSSLNLLANNGDAEDRSNESFVNARPFGSRVAPFPSEFGNLHPLAKLYQNIPVYGMGPLTDDQKREIARRNTTFVPAVTDAGNPQEETQSNNNE